MKPQSALCSLLLLISPLQTPLWAQDYPTKHAENTSLRNEIGLAVDRGLSFLKAAQAPDGSWAPADLPAITALVTTAFLREPSGKYQKERPPFLQKGIDFILANQKPDGGIYEKGYLNYNTSISIMALLAANDPSLSIPIAKARDFVVEGQYKGAVDKIDDPLDGGIGYGNKDKNPDLSNTVIALEALRATKQLEAAGEAPQAKKLNWEAAISFVERCQNLPTNKSPVASPESQDEGGFFYSPISTRGQEIKLPDGRVAYRSYGSMTYAGLLSYIYADLKPEDPRTQAAFNWIQANYTLERNPGTTSAEGLEGLYYYYHMMAKALATYGADELVLKDGKKIKWRKDLAEHLLKVQKADGSWVNENSRWMEGDPVLVTAYALLTLEMISRGL